MMENRYDSGKEVVVNALLNDFIEEASNYPQVSDLVPNLEGLIKGVAKYAFDQGYDAGYCDAIDDMNKLEHDV